MRTLLSALTCACLLAACAAPAPATPPARPPGPTVGGDRDAHGCLASAGYQWCQRTSRCERPWELASARQLASTPEAITAFCRSSPTP